MNDYDTADERAAMEADFDLLPADAPRPCEERAAR